MSKKTHTRIMNEVHDIIKNDIPGISCGVKDDDIFEWQGTIIGQPDTYYENGLFELSISLA